MWSVSAVALCFLVIGHLYAGTINRLKQGATVLKHQSAGKTIFEDSIGDTYEVLKKLGNGTFGDVYLAKDLTDTLKSDIAIKEIRLVNGDCKDLLGCESYVYVEEQEIFPFECEVEALRLLEKLAGDPFITSEKVYIPMKIVEGRPSGHILLSKYRELDNATSWEKLLEFNEFTKKLVKAANDSLSNLHALGILHGDSHLNNFMAKVSIIDGNEEISGEWIDFGRSRLDASKWGPAGRLRDIPTICYYNRQKYYFFHTIEEYERLRHSVLSVIRYLGLLR